MKPKFKKLVKLLLVAGFLFIIFIILRNPKTENPPLPTPERVNFELIRAIPPQNSVSTILPTSAIEFQFSKRIDAETLSIDLTPFEDYSFEISDDGKSLFIRAIPVWKLDTDYKITLNIAAESGEILDDRIDYNFKLIQMTDSNLVE
jgi:hypothetical protein